MANSSSRPLRDSERIQFQLDFRDQMMRRKFWRDLEYLTAFENFPSSSVLLLIARKFRSLAVFIFVRVFSSFGRRKALQGLKALIENESCETALVLGNGPSLNVVNWEHVAEEQQAGKLKIFATNYFLNTDISKLCPPDYLVWSDSDLLPETSEYNIGYLEDVTSRLSGYLVVPWRWSKKKSISSMESKVVFFDDDTRIGWGRSISPLKSRTYGSNVAPKALAIALEMKFERIFVAGIDQDYFKDYFCDSENRIFKSDKIMAEGTAPSNTWECGPYRHGIITRLFRDVYALHYLERHFRDDRIVNLNRTSFLYFWNKVAEKSQFVREK